MRARRNRTSRKRLDYYQAIKHLIQTNEKRITGGFYTFYVCVCSQVVETATQQIPHTFFWPLCVFLPLNVCVRQV